MKKKLLAIVLNLALVLNTSLSFAAYIPAATKQDKTTFTEGTDNVDVFGGVYNETLAGNPSEDQASVVRITATRALHSSIRDAAGNNRGANVDANNNLGIVLPAETTKVIGTARLLGNGGAIFDGVNTAATAPANGLLALGLYNSTEPSPTTGQSVGLQQDSKGRLREVLMDAAGNTRGANVDANNNLGVVLPAETTKVIGTVRNFGNVGAIFDGVNTAATAPANGILGLGIYNSTEPSPTTGQSVGLQLDAKGRQRMVIMDAATNTRGANVNASNQMSVSVDNSNVSANIAQINGVTPLMGNGTTGTGSPRVTISSDNTAFAVNPLSATLPVMSMNSANANSGLNSAMALTFDDVAPTSITENSFGFARMSANRNQYMTIRDAAGNERGVNVNASNQMSVSVDNTVTVGSHAVTNAGTFAVQAAGDVANGSSDSGNPVKIGGIGHTANPTAVTDAQRVAATFDKLGKQVVVGSIRDLKVVQQTTITSSTSETTVGTAVASTFLDVYSVIVTNTSATVTKVTFKDSTAGTTRFVIEVPATETRGFTLPESGAIPQATVNNNWTATCGTSVASVEITLLMVKNT